MDHAMTGTLSPLERLPQEVKDNITSHVDKDRDIPALAMVSKTLRRAVEPFILEQLSVTSDDLRAFYRAFSQDNRYRCRYLKHLHLKIVLPTYSDLDCTQYESANDRTVNSYVFSHHISTLLRLLSDWPKGATLGLSLEAHAPMDVGSRGLSEDTIEQMRRERQEGTLQDLLEERYRYSYLHLLDSFPVPSVACVNQFFTDSIDQYYPDQDQWPWARNIDPATLVILTKAFPNLAKVNLACKDHGLFLALRRKYMIRLAQELATFNPPAACNKMSLELRKTELSRHDEQLPNLSLGDDSVCTVVRKLLERNTTVSNFTYTGPIEPGFFWPTISSSNEHDTSWSPLQTLTIEFEVGGLDGQWLFTEREYNWNSPDSDSDGESDSDRGPELYDNGFESAPNMGDIPLPKSTLGMLPPGYHDSIAEDATAMATAKTTQPPEAWLILEGENPEEIHDGVFGQPGTLFRNWPRREAFVPLLEAIIRRLIHTPSLQRLDMDCKPWPSENTFSFDFYGPGEIAHFDENDEYRSHCRVGIAYSTIDTKFTLGDELKRKIEAIGQARNGKDTIVRYIKNNW